MQALWRHSGKKPITPRSYLHFFLVPTLTHGCGGKLCLVFECKGICYEQKAFFCTHLLDIMNKSLSERSKYLANVISASKLSSLEYISQTLRFEPRPDTCIRILIICVLWQTVWRCVIIQLCAQLFTDVAGGVSTTTQLSPFYYWSLSPWTV